MSILLFISTLVLDFAGVAFAAVYIWLNVFSKIADLSSRNDSILKITKTSMVLSLVFALLSCLLTKAEAIEGALNRAATLNCVIAVSWLLVLLGCGVAMFISFVSKANMKAGLSKEIKRISSIAITGAMIGMLLAWLLG